LSAVIALEEAAADVGKRRLYLAQQAKADAIMALVVRIRDEQRFRQSRKGGDEAIATLLARVEEEERAEPALAAPLPKRKRPRGAHDGRQRNVRVAPDIGNAFRGSSAPAGRKGAPRPSSRQTAAKQDHPATDS
jgi:hypothetical protein